MITNISPARFQSDKKTDFRHTDLKKTEMEHNSVSFQSK